MKKMIAALSAFSLMLTLSFSASAFDTVKFYPELSKKKIVENDELVTFIVEVAGEPVMAAEEAQRLGSDYLDTYSAKQKQSSINNTQAGVMSDVKMVPDTEIGYTYSLLLNGFSVTAPKSAKERLEAIACVENVYMIEEAKLLLGSSVSQINALPSDTVDEIIPTGSTGAGQVIAIIDSEFDVNHDMFKGVPKNPRLDAQAIKDALETNTSPNALVFKQSMYKSAKIPYAYDYAYGDTDTKATTEVLHGTHVAGIAGGKGGVYIDEIQFPAGITVSRTVDGVAPDVQLVLMKAGTVGGGINPTAAVRAMEDAVRFGVCAINMSFGHTNSSQDVLAVYNKAIQAARECGIMVCAAAGNEGMGFIGTFEKTDGYSKTDRIDYSNMGVPSGHSAATTVASAINETVVCSDENNNKFLRENPNASTISYYSTYGVSSKLELKPEISAPGQYIYSASGDEGYKVMSGTSMAAPHMTGVAALMNEYLDAHNVQLFKGARVMRIENLLFSTATVMCKNDALETPYSPRVQGAGLVNVAAAMKTPAIIRGTNGRCKISLKDKLSQSFSFSFEVKNLTSRAVTYDNIGLTLLTDLHTLKEDGNSYVFPGNSIKLENTFSAMIGTETVTSVTVPANGTKSVTITATLSSKQVAELEKIFTNGFFVDGFVSLSKNDNSIPKIGVPLTGFYGEWDAASVFDLSIYHNSQNELDDMVDDINYGTYVYTKEYESNDSITYYIDGISPDNYVSGGFIAVSPNGDGIEDVFGVGFTLWREAKISRIELYKRVGDVKELVYTKNVNRLVPKYTPQKIDIKENTEAEHLLPEGDYVIHIKGTLNYPDAAEQEVTMPIKVDLTEPDFAAVTINDGKATITAADNHYINFIALYSGNTLVSVAEIPYANAHYNAAAELDMGGYDKSELDVVVCDYAGNINVQPLVNLLGKVHAEMPVNVKNNAGFVNIFTLSNVSESTVNGKLIAAYYGLDGTLLASGINNISLSSGGKSNYTFMPENANGAKEVRLFIWSSMDGIKPLDWVKYFDLDW